MAGLLGLAECFYRLDDGDQALDAWRQAVAAPETPLAWLAWKRLAAELVRRERPEGRARRISAGGLTGSGVGTPRDRVADRLAPEGTGQPTRRQQRLPPLEDRRDAHPVRDLHDPGHHRRPRHQRAPRPRCRQPLVRALRPPEGPRRAGRAVPPGLGHAGPRRPRPPALEHVRPLPRRAHRRGPLRLRPVPALLRPDRRRRARWPATSSRPTTRSAPAARSSASSACSSSSSASTIPLMDRQARSITTQIGALIVINLVIGFGLAGGGVGIDNWAHIGGLLAGAWLGLAIAAAVADPGDLVHAAGRGAQDDQPAQRPAPAGGGHGAGRGHRRRRRRRHLAADRAAGDARPLAAGAPRPIARRWRAERPSGRGSRPAGRDATRSDR